MVSIVEQNEINKDLPRVISNESLDSTSSNVEAQQHELDSAMNAVKVQTGLMTRSLNENKLMDALRHCSLMLNELRSSVMAPKAYYQVYMAAFDALGGLAGYLFDSHMRHEHHLSDLYELVQYAGSIIPRLYMMITVGSAYMKVAKVLDEQGKAKISAPDALRSPGSGENSDDSSVQSPIASPTSLGEELDFNQVPPIKNIMKDMLEMSRGVQDPVRGLFLRYYLITVTRDCLPTGFSVNPHGTIMDSVVLILSNFNEMNKLWVRLQFQGSARHRERRTQERKELQLLVGTNLVRLSELDTGAEAYAAVVLPSVLNEAISCHDALAQEYLLEIIIQVFPDEYHLAALNSLLPAIALLEKDVNAEKLVISLLARFAAYAKQSPDVLDKDGYTLFELFWKQVLHLVEERKDFSYGHIVEIMKSLLDLTLASFPDKLEYVDRILGFLKAQKLKDHAANTGETSASATSAEQNAKDCRTWESPSTSAALCAILKQILVAYGSDKFVQSIRSMPSACKSVYGGAFSWLHACLLLHDRKHFALCFLETVLAPFTKKPMSSTASIGGHKCLLKSSAEVWFVFGELLSVFTVETGELAAPNIFSEEIDWDDTSQDFGNVGKLLCTIGKSNFVTTGDAREFLDSERWKLKLELFLCLGDILARGSPLSQRFLLPCLILNALQILREAIVLDISSSPIYDAALAFFQKVQDWIESLSMCGSSERPSDFADAITSNFSLLHATGVSSAVTSSLARSNGFGDAESHLGPLVCLAASSEMACKLYFSAVRVIDELSFALRYCGGLEARTDAEGAELKRKKEVLEDFGYELFVRGVLVYEEMILDSSSQCFVLSLAVNALYSSCIFSLENYETLAGKLTLAASRLLKRPDQIVCMMRCALLYEKGGVPDGAARKQVDLYLKSLKLAESVVDKVLQCSLLIDILEQMARAMAHNSLIEAHHVNKVVLATGDRLRILLPFALPIQDADGHDVVGVSVLNLLRHVRNFIGYVQFLRHEEAQSDEKRKIWGSRFVQKEREAASDSAEMPSLTETKLARLYGSLDVSTFEAIIRQADEIRVSGMTRATDLTLATLTKQASEIVNRKSIHIDALFSLFNH